MCPVWVLCETPCKTDETHRKSSVSPPYAQYSVNPESVKMVGNKLLATLVPSKEQTTDLELVATILPNDLIRIHISEQNPLNGRRRFEATDVLIPGMLCSLRPTQNTLRSNRWW